MKKVVILLSTYNGSKYVEEQLISLLKQTYDNVIINIRDDSSCDDTTKILEKYAADNKVRIIPSSSNIGVVNSYRELLKYCDKGDYYAFCDQDDIWKDNKIELAVKALDEINDEKIPVLYASDYDLCDTNGHLTDQNSLGNKKPSFPKALMETIAPGMTMVFNEKMRQMLVSTLREECVLHDGWATLIAAGMGKIYYDSTSTVLYRKHSSSVTNASKTRVGKLLTLLEKKHWDNLRMILKYFDECYGNSLKAKDLKLLRLFTSKKKVYSQFSKAFYLGRYKDNIIKDFLVRFLFIFNVI